MKSQIVRIKVEIGDRLEEKLFILRRGTYIPLIIPTGQKEHIIKSKVKESKVIGEIELPDYCDQSIRT